MTRTLLGSPSGRCSLAFDPLCWLFGWDLWYGGVCTRYRECTDSLEDVRRYNLDLYPLPTLVVRLSWEWRIR